MGSKFGFDPLTILAIIQAIQAIFAACKKPQPPGPATLPAKLVAREQERIRKGKDAKCPDRFRHAFNGEGVYNKKTQDQMWAAMIGYAAGLPESGLKFAE